jgi:hypothetical protein
MTLYPRFPYFCSLVTFYMDVHIKVSNICEFREKRCGESHTVARLRARMRLPLSPGLSNVLHRM